MDTNDAVVFKRSKNIIVLPFSGNQSFMKTPLEILAVILIIAGLILAYNPVLISSAPTQLIGYEMIEKRVKWGFLIGLGIFLVFNQQWDNWGLTILAFLSSLTIGIIIARILGFILDGLFSRQLLWLLIELAMLGVFSFFYWRLKAS